MINRKLEGDVVKWTEIAHSATPFFVETNTKEIHSNYGVEICTVIQ